jgi:hypothetical protein
MIITSQFFIITYLGKEPLTLLSAPDNMSADQKIQYNTFLDNVNAIYASEDSTGIIPTFYKTAGAADTNSTLTKLVGNKAYYVVMSPTATLPINIPAIGGLIQNGGVGECTVKDIPQVTFPAPSFILEGENQNYQYLSINIAQLVPGKRYQYKLSNFQSNWPIKILPKEGIITPQSPSQNISAYVMFAPSLDTADCPDCFTNYILDPDYKENYAQNNLYAIIQISVVAEPFDLCVPVVQSIPIRCKLCLPKRPVNYPSVKFTNSPKLTLSGNCGDQVFPITVEARNFDKGKPYKYLFSINNPTSTVTPGSGTAGFGDGSGQISTLVNIKNISPIIVKVEVTSQDGLNKISTDFLTIECSNC